MKPVTILLVDLDANDGLCDSLRAILDESFQSDFKLQITRLKGIERARVLDNVRANLQLGPSVVFLALQPTLLNEAATVLGSLRQDSRDIPVIILADARDPELMLELLGRGASDFITPPLKAIDVVPRVWRSLEQARQQSSLVYTLKQKLGLKRMVGESSAFSSQIKKLPTVARCDASLVLLGETGTGKELCARAIHHLSPRASRPFVPVNCGAIPVELVENEFFGHEREAFTGATSSRLGLIHQADGGTLFLDEIDCLPLLAQVKLLRFLQDKEYRPLGSMKMRQADVRMMAASNVDLEEAVIRGKLRRDLYYRLNVISLTLPPLRERREDIPLLARHFLARFAAEFDRPVSNFSDDAMQMMLGYDWPGNVRELEHVVERAVVMCEAGAIGIEDLCIPQTQPGASAASFQEMKARTIDRFERNYINSLLSAHEGNISRAAWAAQKDPRALRHLIRKHNIDVSSYKHNS